MGSAPIRVQHFCFLFLLPFRQASGSSPPTGFRHSQDPPCPASASSFTAIVIPFSGSCYHSFISPTAHTSLPPPSPHHPSPLSLVLSNTTPRILLHFSQHLRRHHCPPPPTSVDSPPLPANFRSACTQAACRLRRDVGEEESAGEREETEVAGASSGRGKEELWWWEGSCG